MLTFDRATTGIRDYSSDAARARVVMPRASAWENSECSDPYMEWASRFEQGLKRIEERVRAWSRDAGSLADDDLIAPSRETITRAFEITGQLSSLVMDRVAPANTVLFNLKGASLGGGGEISIELDSGPHALTYRIEPDGAVTKLIFRDNRLVRRELIPR